MEGYFPLTIISQQGYINAADSSTKWQWFLK